MNHPPKENKGGLLDDDFLGLNMNQQQQPPSNINFNQNPITTNQQPINFNQPTTINNPVTQPPPPVNQISLEPPKQVQPETHKFKGF